MTEKLKIPGKIVGITSFCTSSVSGDEYEVTQIATETGVYRMYRGDPDTLHHIIDTTDYQDKPTEKELEEEKVKKERQDKMRGFLNGAVDSILEVIESKDGDKLLPEAVVYGIAAIAELNRMDEREETK